MGQKFIFRIVTIAAGAAALTLGGGMLRSEAATLAIGHGRQSSAAATRQYGRE